MLSIIILNVVMLSVVKLIVVRLSVVVLLKLHTKFKAFRFLPW